MPIETIGPIVASGPLNNSLASLQSEITAHKADYAKEVGKVFNVVGYGALPGVGDNTIAIQAVINAAKLVPGSIVWFPSGTFLASNLRILNAANLTIDGPGEIKSLNGLHADGLILIEDSEDITIKNLFITGKGGLGSGSSDDGITIKRTKNYRITGGTIKNFSRNAISLWGHTVYDDNFKDPSMIDNNNIKDNYVSILINGDAEYFDIVMNKITGNEFGIYGGFGNINVRSNQVSYNVVGIQLDGTLHSNGDHNSISGNKINHNRAVGLRIMNVDNRISIVDNQIVSTVGPETFGATGFSYSLVLENVKNLQVIGNQVDGGSGSKIRISGHTACHYIGNVFFSGNVEELTAGSRNYFVGNTYVSGGLALHAGSTETIRSYEDANGTFIGLPADTINKIQATLLGTCTNTGGVFETLCYWKDGEGTIHVQGTVNVGALFDNITLLPVEYRPRKNMDRPTTTGDGGLHGSIRIYSNGNIQLTSGATTQVHIHASFKP